MHMTLNVNQTLAAVKVRTPEMLPSTPVMDVEIEAVARYVNKYV